MSQRHIGYVLVITPEVEWGKFPIKEIVQPSDREISLDLEGPGGMLATVSFESHDSQHFTGTYRTKSHGADGIIRVVKVQMPNGTLLLVGRWEKANGEEWHWQAEIKIDEDPEDAL